MSKQYETVIGLEIHAELSTKSKAFCLCSAEFGGDVNTHICPTCIGHPGTLPIINGEAVSYAMRAGLAFGCTINHYCRFDRKNYFYPDLVKAYQVTQADFPLCTNGKLKLSTGNTVRINRIHFEEDTGKLTHDDYNGVSLADFNRCSVPLIEIVTEPDITSADEAIEFVSTVALYLKYLGICDAKMQEGSIRADVNVSIREAGSDKLGQRVETKNISSLRAMKRAIEFEASRQAELLNTGGVILQETRRFDESMGETLAMRSKENANDYRYFPEPDVMGISITDEDIEAVRKQLPLLPRERRELYVSKHGLTENDAEVLTSEKYISDFYDEAVKIYSEYKNVANFMMTEVLRRIKETNAEEISVSPADFAEIVKMADTKVVNRNDAKTVLRILFEQGGKPMDIAKESGFIIEQDDAAIAEFIDRLLAERSDLVEAYHNGKTNAFGFFMGQATQALRSKATPQAIKQYLESKLKG